jgi:hypothetical protein
MGKRTARVTDVSDEGHFAMTLATEGEASDGDILSIRGGVIPDQMPLLISHANHPTEVAGSITQMQKYLKESPARLRAVGKIDLGGSGEQADIRRDIHHMILQGHITGVSVRWDQVDGGKQPVRRTELPKDHRAHVRDDEPSPRKRMGMFWPEWRAIEGSVVALGADSQALIGRANETEGHVREFWRSLASEIEVFDLAPDIAAALWALRLHAQECRELGANASDLLNAVIEAERADDFDAVTLAEHTFFLPHAVADLLREREEPEAPDLEPPLEEPDLALDDRDLDPEPEGIAFDQDSWIERIGVLLEERDVRRDAEREVLIERMTTIRDTQRQERFQKMLETRLGRVS